LLPLIADRTPKQNKTLKPLLIALSARILLLLKISTTKNLKTILLLRLQLLNYPKKRLKINLMLKNARQLRKTFNTIAKRS
jgi:hypothetical protein